MPKNKGLGGKKFRSTKKNYGLDTRNTVLKDSEQNYAMVLDVLGNGRFRCNVDNGEKLLGILCGNMKKRKIWVNRGDLILVSRRDYEKDKVDIISKYNHDEWDYLKSIEPCLENLIKDDKINSNEPEFYTQGEVMDIEYMETLQDNDNDSDNDSESLDIDNL